MRRPEIPEAPVVVPCNPDDCFMSRDGVLKNAQGGSLKDNPFLGLNFIAKLVVAKGGDQVESFRDAIDDINTVACSDVEGLGIVCPRLTLAHATLEAAGGVDQLQEYMAAERSCQATVPLSTPDVPPIQN